MTIFKNSFQRILKDLKRKELIPLKLIFFFSVSTSVIITPFLTIHKKALGISIEEIAIIDGVLPFIFIIVSPITGIIADRIGNFKLLMTSLSAFCGIESLLLLLIPVGRVTLQFPEKIVFDARCMNESNLIYSMKQNYPCDLKNITNLDMELQSCGYGCQFKDTNESRIEELLSAKSYEIREYDARTNNYLTFSYLLPDAEMSKVLQSEKLESFNFSQKLKEADFHKSVRRLSENYIYFPGPNLQMFEFKLKQKNKINDTVYKLEPTVSEVERDQNLQRFKINLKALEVTDADSLEMVRRYQSLGVKMPSRENVSVRCTDTEQISNVALQSSNETSFVLKNCARRCIFTAARNDMCQNSSIQFERNARLTFWSYLIILLIMSIVYGISATMFEGAVVATMREHKADYGLQKIYGYLGAIISSPLSGLLIDYSSRGKGYTDFRLAFYLYAVMSIATSFFTLLLNLEFKSAASNVKKDLMMAVKNVELAALFVMNLMAGLSWGFLTTFLFWFLEDIGAPSSLMGTTMTVGAVAGLPLLAYADVISSKIGHINVLFISFIVKSLRLLGYSFIYNPYLSLLLEAFESITVSVTSTAIVTYAAKLSTSTTDSSIQALVGTITAVGYGFGSLTGGYLITAFGIRSTFRIFAAINIISAISYRFFTFVYFSKTESEVDKVDNGNNVAVMLGKKDVALNCEETREIRQRDILNSNK